MSNKQLAVLWVGVGLIVLMCLYPPWLRTTVAGSRQSPTAIVAEAGYGFIFTSNHEYIALGRFALQCLAGALLTATGIYTLRTKGK